MPYKKRASQWFGKICPSHPEKLGLRAPSGVCVKCNSERVVRYHQSARGKQKPSRVVRARTRNQQLMIKGWDALDKNLISSMYALASIYRDQCHDVHVDHIVPLNGEFCSGLHVGCNLTILPAAENLKKGNKYDHIA